MQTSLRLALVPGLVVLCSLTAAAQLNNPWARFAKDTSRIQNPDGSIATQVTNDGAEKDYAWGDLDRDGWTDVVVVRRQPAGMNKFSAQLLMNDHGILVDRTNALAVGSTLPGDLGFLTLACSTDVQIADLDGDQWPDVVTSATLSDSDLKEISHPRIYMNKGAIGGVWQGLRYEDARIPQLFTIPAGQPVAPRFFTVAVGDVTGDGFPDLFFTDHDQYNTIVEQPANDLNDRLLVNDGTGNFTDTLETRMSAHMLNSRFGVSSNIVDMNGDGAPDIVKASPQPNTLFPDRWVTYNTPQSIGIFGVHQDITISSTAPYAMDVGDLNKDGRPDIVVGDDGVDFFQLNLGNEQSGIAIFGPRTNVSFAAGSDQGFSGQVRIVDLDGDGWLDTIHADFDAEIPSCNRYTHVYHNLGGIPGGQIVLRHEVQLSGSAGWKGAVGMITTDLQGVFDVAAFDIDNDGDIDLVLGRCSGTTVWINQKTEGAAPAFCFGDGSGTACPCGNGSGVGKKDGCLNSLSLGGRLRMVGTPSVSADTLGLEATQIPNGPALFFQGTWAVNVGAGAVLGDGLLCVGGDIVRLGVAFASSNAVLYPRAGIDPAISVQASLAAGNARTYQAWYRDADLTFCSPGTFNLTNALSIFWQN